MNDFVHTEARFERRSAVSFVAAALAAMVAVGGVMATVDLFSSEGRPMERLAIAERACAAHSYVSARESCMREWLAARQAAHVASR